MITTRFTERFGLAHPIMSAPMALHSGGTLAGAVSAAGGLGSFGGVHPTKGPGWLRDEVAIVRATTDRPFAIGFITPFLAFTEELFETALAARPAAVAFSFADPAPWVERVKAIDAAVMCQVQNFDDAAAAVAAGADILIAQGTEAGGHTGTMSLLPFLAGLAERYPNISVLAAGGIADGRTLAAVLTAGADGAWIGTAFLATPEAVEVHDVHKALIVESDGADTVFTRLYDIKSGLPWPSTIGERVRRNAFTDEWSERETDYRAHRAEATGNGNGHAFDATPDPTTDAILYGQSAMFVEAVRPAAEVLRQISDDAEAILRSRPGDLLS